MSHIPKQEQTVSGETVPSSPPDATTPVTCRRCGAIDLPVVSPNAGMHAFRADCAHCGAWIRWLSKYDQATRKAKRTHYYLQSLATQGSK